MKVWKRNAVVAAIVLFVCVAVYLNWSYSQGQSVAATESNADTKTLGEAELVSAQEGVTVLGEEETVSVAELPEESYFDAARLSRQEARDEAIAILQATIDDPNAAEAAIATASESIAELAKSTTAEAEIENLISAKGYQDCVAYIGENSVSVVVSAGETGLQATDVAKITDIVLGQIDVSADQVKIIEAN